MANFRAERLLIRVDDAVDFDPNDEIDIEEFAFIMVTDVQALGRASLQDFTIAPYDTPQWFLASEGLATVRAKIEELETTLASAVSNKRDSLEKEIDVLRAVEDRLDRIDTRDVKFHFLAQDLG